jgi:hypothetical protein
MSISFLLSLCHLSFSRRYNSAFCSFFIWFLPIFQATLTDRDDFLFSPNSRLLGSKPFHLNRSFVCDPILILGF